MNRYSKVRVLGAGSYGQAILCKDLQSRNGARKVVVKQMTMPENQLAEAKKEAEVMRGLSHSNVTALFDCFVEAKKFFIVMEFADGGDLAAAIDRKRKRREYFSEDKVMVTFVQCLVAIDHVHARKVLHRDIKSANIFLTASGVVKIGDFGIAKVLDHTTDLAQTQIGTPYYTSPEIFQNRPYGNAADVWSLGCVLYELVCLRLPFEAPSMHKVRATTNDEARTNDDDEAQTTTTVRESSSFDERRGGMNNGGLVRRERERRISGWLRGAAARRRAAPRRRESRFVV